MRLGGAGGRVIGKSEDDPSVSHFFGDFFGGTRLNAGPGVLALQTGLLQWSGAAGAPSWQPRRGLIQTGFPSRVLAMRRSSPVYNSRSNPNDYLLEIHARLT